METSWGRGHHEALGARVEWRGVGLSGHGFFHSDPASAEVETYKSVLRTVTCVTCTSFFFFGRGNCMHCTRTAPFLDEKIFPGVKKNTHHEHFFGQWRRSLGLSGEGTSHQQLAPRRNDQRLCFSNLAVVDLKTRSVSRKAEGWTELHMSCLGRTQGGPPHLQKQSV